jgi:hypothetical protein
MGLKNLQVSNNLSIPEVTQSCQVEFLEKKVKITYAEPTSVLLSMMEPATMTTLLSTLGVLPPAIACNVPLAQPARSSDRAFMLSVGIASELAIGLGYCVTVSNSQIVSVKG